MKKLFAILFTGILITSLASCGNNDTVATDRTSDTTAPIVTNADTSKGTEENTTAADTIADTVKNTEKSFEGLIDTLVAKGYITKEGDGGSFADAIGAINGYRYYNLDTLETTEIYEFESEYEANNVSFYGSPWEPDKVIGSIAFFSDNEALLADAEAYLK